MKVKRTVTIVLDRVKITTAHGYKVHGWCELCQAEAEFLNQAEADQLASVFTARGLTINERDLHYYHPTDDQILVCVNSMLNGNNPKDFTK